MTAVAEKHKPVLKIDWATHEAAKYACENWHYSKCLPVGKLIKLGIWEDSSFVGVIIFGRGANKSLLAPYGLKQEQGAELVRIAMREHKTEVTRCVSIAFKMLKKHYPNLLCVVSFADPEQGHEGKIYKAGNWIYDGMTAGADEYIYNGKRWHGRAFRKSFGSHLKYIDKGLKIVDGSRKHRFVYWLNNRVISIENDAIDDQSKQGGVNPTITLQKQGTA